MEKNTETYTLEDTTIAQIAKVLQVAILTGTDISDNLRQLQLTVKNNGKIAVTDEYLSIFNTNIEKMLNSAQVNEEPSGQGQLSLNFD